LIWIWETKTHPYRQLTKVLRNQASLLDPLSI
jgi:hypothetical protein